MNRIIREYARLPSWLPLPCHWEHGWTPLSEPLNSDLGAHHNVVLVFSQRRKDAWERAVGNSRKVVVLGNPFVHYRRMHGIAFADRAKGTIAFPSHSCPNVRSEFAVQDYCKRLSALPAEFKPVTVCLHHHDYSDSLVEYYRGNGFTTVTAGDQFSDNFPGNFYDILRRHRFATSNTVGSYSFHAVELGLSFFVLGELPVHTNDGENPDVPLRYSILDFQYGKAAYSLFDTGPVALVSREQKEFVEKENGIGACINGHDLRKMLLREFGRPSRVIRAGTAVCAAARRRASWAVHGLAGRLGKAVEQGYIWRHGLQREDRIFTHMTASEKILLHKLVRSKAKESIVCVEIGSYLGASSCFIADGLRNHSILHCVDTWSNEAMKYDEGDVDGDQRDTFPEFQRNTTRFACRIRIHRGRSEEMIRQVRGEAGRIDFLLIDANHEYEAVRRDWSLYSRLLCQGSLVVFHDTGWASGVQQVVAQEVRPVGQAVARMPNMEVYRMFEPVKCAAEANGG